MIIPSPHTGKRPRISPLAFIAPTATIIGDVTIEEGVNIWYGAVIRGDVCTIKIGKNTSIQDNCVVHSEEGTTCTIGDHIIIGHKALVHGECSVGRGTMVGMASVIMQNTIVGEEVIIAAGALARKEVPARTLIAGIPAVVKKELNKEEIEKTYQNARFYANNGKKYREAGYNHPGIDEFYVIGI
jgi:carbonic anhydrase/acetyltransferase-like protein (isoleucine patch superfamily)